MKLMRERLTVRFDWLTHFSVTLLGTKCGRLTDFPQINILGRYCKKFIINEFCFKHSKMSEGDLCATYLFVYSCRSNRIACLIHCYLCTAHHAAKMQVHIHCGCQCYWPSLQVYFNSLVLRQAFIAFLFFSMALLIAVISLCSFHIHSQ